LLRSSSKVKLVALHFVQKWITVAGCLGKVARYFLSGMKWIARGYVTEVHRNYFWSRLQLRNRPREPLEAKIAQSKLSKRERSLLADGAYFLILKTGAIHFLRLRITKAQIERAKKRGHELVNELFGGKFRTDEGETD
jgi:hypothetical protein